MSETKEILSLLRENNKMLREILEYVRTMSNPKHIEDENAKEFAYNLIADLLVERMRPAEKEDILRNIL